MSGVEAAALLLFGLFMVSWVFGAMGYYGLLVRLRNYHHDEWEAILGTGIADFVVADFRMLSYAFGRRWESLEDRRVAALVHCIRGSVAIGFVLLIGLFAMAVALMARG